MDELDYKITITVLAVIMIVLFAALLVQGNMLHEQKQENEKLRQEIASLRTRR